MKRTILILTALLLVAVLLFAACAPAAETANKNNGNTGGNTGSGSGTGDDSNDGSGTGSDNSGSTGSGSGNGGTSSGGGSGADNTGTGTGSDNSGDNGNGGSGSDIGGGGTGTGTGDADEQDDGYIGDKSILTRFSDETTAQNNSFYKNYSAEEKSLYYTLWKETTTISIKIDITPYELNKLNEAYTHYHDTNNSERADTYRKCNLTITVNGRDYQYQEVGVRMRGNTSRRNFCNGSGEIYDYVHLRFNLSETFDGEEYADGAWAHEIAHDWSGDAEGRAIRKDRSFATMEKFYYKWNKNYDNTYIREIYANRMFLAHGVLAPHITLTQIQLLQNGHYENLGVGNLYETVDKQFIKRNFSKTEKGGDLYKCTWPADLTSMTNYGVETPTQRFAYSLKTNDDRTSPNYNGNKYLRAFIEALQTSQNDSQFKSTLEGVIDMDYFTNFEAVNYLLGNPDCIRNNKNNYYLYFVPTTGKAIIIPYDYDRCLGIDVDWNPSGNSMTSAKPFEVHAYGGNDDVNNPLYRKTILEGGLTEYQQMFQSKLQYVLDGKWFTYQHFQGIFQSYKANYQQLAMPSETIRSACGGNVRMDMLEMSERGTNDLNVTHDNLTTEKYMQLKRQSALNNLKTFATAD